MSLDAQPALPLREPRPSALKPLLWLVAAAALAVGLLMLAPVPPL
jgi:hypothetical protein